MAVRSAAQWIRSCSTWAFVSVRPPLSSCIFSMASMAATCFITSALLDAAPCVAEDGVAEDGVAEDGVAVVPLVPVVWVAADGVAEDGVAEDGVAGDWVAAGCVAALLAGSVAEVAAAGDVDAAPPLAAFSKAVRLRRRSTSFSRSDGSIVGAAGAVVEPDVPTAPAVPEAFVGSLAVGSGPSSAVRLAFTLAYDSRHWLCAVISSLKLEINCATWVRASPLN